LAGEQPPAFLALAYDLHAISLNHRLLSKPATRSASTAADDICRLGTAVVTSWRNRRRRAQRIGCRRSATSLARVSDLASISTPPSISPPQVRDCACRQHIQETPLNHYEVFTEVLGYSNELSDLIGKDGVQAMTSETIIAISFIVALFIGFALGYNWRDLALRR
jgi:hypothetical protein